MENYYDVLGVSKESSMDDIKKAYRKKAMQHHPDKGGDESLFKKTQEAYDVLSDDNKRANYDRGGQFRGPGFDFEDIFNMNSPFSRQRKAEDVKINIELSLKEIVFGTTKKIRYKKRHTCDLCHGTGAEKMNTCTSCNGNGQVVEVINTMLGHITRVANCGRCRGSGKTMISKCIKCDGLGYLSKDETVDITIPIGCLSSDILSLAGAGHQQKDHVPGDLHIIITESFPDGVSRDGLNIIVDKTISIADAVLGNTIRIESVNGNFDVNVPNGCTHGKILNIKAKGIPNKNNTSYFGDLLIRVSIAIPKILTHEQREIFEELKKLD